MKNDESSLHAGHRARMTESVNKIGILGLTEIQQIEWILTFIFPRGDVNPLAHRLLKKYQCFANMVDASIEDLCQVPGINTRSAIKLKSLKDISTFYHISKMKNKIDVNNVGEFLNFIENILRNETTEHLYFFALNQKGIITQYRQIDMDAVRAVGISPEMVCNFANSSKLTHLVIAHNHPDGSAMPSPDDTEAISMVKGFLLPFGATIYDSFIVGEDGIYSCVQDGFVRMVDNSLL